MQNPIESLSTSIPSIMYSGDVVFAVSGIANRVKIVNQVQSGEVTNSHLER